MTTQSKQAQFLAKARAVHGDKYDYSEAEYQKAILKVRIICSTHGPFMQAPNPHLRGSGCPACGSETTSRKLSHGKAGFIQKARAVHGDKYNYTKGSYAGAHANIEIVCPQHGPFLQSPTSHLAGRACPACSLVQRADKKKYSQAQFLAKARAVHGDKYDYSDEANFKRGKFLCINITCPEHGRFQQRRTNHLRGVGCTKCALALTRRNWVSLSNGRLATLYFLELHRPGERFYKVGVTYMGVKNRFSKYDLNGYQYKLLALYESFDASAIFDHERAILKAFSEMSYMPKLAFGGASECFAEAEPILATLPAGTRFYE
jgi:ssDNA-binding Zn-finger/Zn-ribbon topoisomerase 1